MVLSDLQRLSNGLIIYSVILSDFEKPDFKNDALAGVRANYFNSHFSPQNEKTEIMLDERVFGLSYSMKQGQALSWKVTYNKRPYQTVKRTENGSYCVVSYADNGIVSKRIYFDELHTWLRTEYYDGKLSGVLRGVVTPKKIDRVLALVYERVDNTGEKSREVLFPSTEVPKKRCAALIYSNSGMIWYDKSFKPEEIDEDDFPEFSGFMFELSLFNSELENKFDLRSSDYLSRDDIEETPAELESEPAHKGYSAYDRIEQILFEAHKTNKNIFGEIANHAAEIDFDENIADDIISEVDLTDGVSAAAEPENDVDFEPEEADDSEPVAETDGEAPGEAKTSETPCRVEGQDEEPQKEIITEGGVYSYFGTLSDDGLREGKGRVVSPDGVVVYYGGYRRDKREGFGVCYYKDGSPNYVGGWQDGTRSGSGVGFRRSDGTMHVGKWSDNSPVEIGARFDNEGNFLDVCQYSDGLKHGKSISFDENGNVVIRVYREGEIVSERVITDGEE